jgi:hypothetical protein
MHVIFIYITTIVHIIVLILRQQNAIVENPAYMTRHTRYDLTALLSREELQIIPRDELEKLKNVSLWDSSDTFPHKTLKKYTSMDDDQLDVIHDSLSKVFALILFTF